jgi:uncharacterized membrane protein YqjE
MNGTDFGDRRSDVPPGGIQEPPVASLFRDLYENTVELVRRELNLAGTEMSRKVGKAGKDSMFIAVGGGVAYAGFLFLLAAAVIELSVVIPIALSALLVGIVVLAIGASIVYVGQKRLREEDFVPRKTIETLREDKEWMQNQVM